MQHGIAARVADVDAAKGRSVRFGRLDLQRLANLLQRVFAGRMKLDQPRRKQTAPLLQVDAARDAAVAHGIGRAGVGIARVGNRLDRRGKVALGRLLAECVTPLERPLGRFHDPCRVNRRRLRLGADIVQHHK